jgi:anti-sigma28 factor (negative regulator of flagellin synthesis)
MYEDSDLEKVLKRLMELLNQEEDMKQKRIEEIKRLIAEGEYNVPIEELVESILKKLKERS